MTRAWQAFIPMQPPTVTHNSLCIQYKCRAGHRIPFIAKTDQLKKAEDDLAAYVSRAALGAASLPLTGPLRETLRFVWEPSGEHEGGTARTEPPDLDNLCKTFNDVLQRCHVIGDDKDVVDLHLVKAYGKPAGIFVRIEELRAR